MSKRVFIDLTSEEVLPWLPLEVLRVIGRWVTPGTIVNTAKKAWDWRMLNTIRQRLAIVKALWGDKFVYRGFDEVEVRDMTADELWDLTISLNMRATRSLLGTYRLLYDNEKDPKIINVG